MKALSMKQPVPELILQGKKTIELRNWNTKFRGTFALHASLSELNGFDLDPRDLPHGAIVGTADLIDVIKFQTKKDFNKLEDKHLAKSKNWFVPGKTYGFILKNPKRLEKPIQCKGQLNFFDVPIKDKRQRLLSEASI